MYHSNYDLMKTIHYISNFSLNLVNQYRYPKKLHIFTIENLKFATLLSIKKTDFVIPARDIKDLATSISHNTGALHTHIVEKYNNIK